ncbi:MAG TPA: DUF5317 family protein, partial [Acidimicrobiia bacterium]|nr:DUF5317 family protein [Acidimicrobiia bacterium]
MSFFLITVAVAVGIALTTGGSLSRILETRLRATWALFLALAVQLGLDLLGSGPSSDTAFALLVASYGLLLLFCASNLRLRGMSVVAIGIALNALVIMVNHGMPIRTHGASFTATVKHHVERPSDRLMPLADIIVVDEISQALSFGDLIMLVGLIDVLVHRSRAVEGRVRHRRDETAASSAFTDTPPAPPAAR